MEQYTRAVLDSLHDAVFVDDARTGRIIDVNRRMCEMYGYTREEALACDVGQLSEGSPPYAQHNALEWLRKAREEGPQTFDWLARARDGRLFWVEISIRFVLIGGEERFIVMAHEIARRKRMEEELNRLATIDPLTMLYNRRHFLVLAEREYEAFRRYRRPLALVMADIDHFKQVNDRHGHRIGDEVLRAVAERLTQNLRQIDLLGRYGGEEFLILLTETDRETARLSAERLRGAIAGEPFDITADGLTVTLSFGVAVLDGDAEFSRMPSIDALLDAADRALYRAKHEGRNRVAMWEWRAGSGAIA